MAQMAFAAGARLAAGALRTLAAQGVARLFSAGGREPARPEGLDIQTSTEGSPVPRVYGRMRLAGQVVWASRFRETRVKEQRPGKGTGGSTSSYAYSVSFAVALCEGPIAGVGRVWANGAPLDTGRITMRVHAGTEGQLPDPLIAMIEGADAAPAYKGLAYVVFEDLPLDDFGLRIPQLSFEVLGGGDAPESGSLESLIEGVCLIPASGEFAYASQPVMREIADGRDAPENVHILRADTNIEAALDDLAMRLPECRSVALVTAWIGTDLRCGECEIRPGIESFHKITRPHAWQAGGVNRPNAHLISGGPEKPVYGGTPSDRSVIQAIQLLKSRGYKVVLYPFILMDVPQGNALPDPYGGAEQAVFPWRGRITCHPAPGQPGSVDASSAAAAQVASFFGSASASHFSTASGQVSYSGPNEWRFSRFILHHAALAAAAGGVDAFLIGSEMRGLTTIRSASGFYPATAHLKTLAGEVRALLGAGCKLSYAADWSEYWGHAPGGGERRFHLDPLWADANIDFIGLDWYIPLADWRDGATHLDALAGFSSTHDPDYLTGQVEGGEGFDWYYASPADREAQTRTPITDGQGEPWIWRYKDLRSWWSEAHHERNASGTRLSQPTAWIPRSKPFAFIEYGCPAVDKGANQPNVFIDPKSSESFAPYFSRGTRDDVIQRRYMEALMGYWQGANNPVSPLYGGLMIDLSLGHAWTWDARPFPEFPALSAVWDDGANWQLGHWLTGRAGQASLARIVQDVAARAGLESVDTTRLDGLVAGLVIDGGERARDVLARLGALYGFDMVDRADGVTAWPRSALAVTSLDASHCVRAGNAPPLVVTHEAAAGRVREVRIAHITDDDAYSPAMASARGLDAAVEGVAEFGLRILADTGQAQGWAQGLLRSDEAGALGVDLMLPPSLMAVEAGDTLILSGETGMDAPLMVASLEGVAARQAALVPASGRDPVLAGTQPSSREPDQAPPSRPVLVALDLPVLPGEASERGGLWVAAFAAPWPGPLTLHAGPDVSSVVPVLELEQPASLGHLAADLPAGFEGRWDRASVLDITLFDGALESVAPLSALSGVNQLAVEGPDGWEIIQFASAELIAPSQWRLRDLIRGLGGSAVSGAPSGARVVVLDGAGAVLPLDANALGAPLTLIAVPPGRSLDDVSARQVEALYDGVEYRPLSPVHLKAVWQGDDLALSWIRRTRLEGDAWGIGEVGLGEAEELYGVEVRDSADALLWTGESTLPSILVPAATALELPAGAYWQVAQMSARTGPGRPAQGALPAPLS
ncbi:glycoside hydrolase TIM-barrel-like domain-containing protein [Glycocaulis abyssi]|uniref:Glycoside hydrolase TIM-barrel-like domain-containing protein n=1 Tax=Glycocaulis abyssi TaxID=1433403 RepID=A0ABV9N7P1_9PROT